MTISAFPPFLVLLVAGLLLPALRGPLRAALLLFAPVLTLWLVWQVPDGVAVRASWLGYELALVKGDALARLFGTVFALAAFGGALFALGQPRIVELAAAFCYAAGAIGVAFAGDLLSLFVFWELMAIASTLVVLSAGAERAALRYAAIHFLGGVLLMAGIAGEIAATGSTALGPLALDSVPRALIFAGFLINAGAWPLSAWLPDAYPESSWSGMVFLSAFTTKAAVLVLLRAFPGTTLLIWIGLAMVFYGIVYAIRENDMRRLLAYSIVSQVGFMTTGIGIGTPLALDGVAMHAFAHIIYKALLLMATGAVLQATGRRLLSELGGLSRTMRLTALCCIIGAASISGLPLTSGFVSKSMIQQAAGDQHLAWPFFLLVAASVGTAFYVGYKLCWFVFFGRDSGLRAPDPSWNMRLAMILMAALCIVIGIMPGPIYALLPMRASYAPYTGAHVTFQLQLLLAAGLVFFLALPWLRRLLGFTLDVDWFWRCMGRAVMRAADRWSDLAWRFYSIGVVRDAQSFARAVYRATGPTGALARTWPTGLMAFWTAVLLAAFLVLSYV